MEMRLRAIIILLGVLLQKNCLFIYFQQDYQNTTYYKCIKPTVNGRIILEFDYEQNDYDCVVNIQNAMKAGLVIELPIFPNRCSSIDQQFQIFLTKLEGKTIDRFWGVAADVDQGCSWSQFSPQSNCHCHFGMKIQMISNAFEWKMNIFKNTAACPQISTKSLLWWAPDEEQEYVQFGGWKTPYMQPLGQIQLCGDGIYVNKVL